MASIQYVFVHDSNEDPIVLQVPSSQCMGQLRKQLVERMNVPYASPTSISLSKEVPHLRDESLLSDFVHNALGQHRVWTVVCDSSILSPRLAEKLDAVVICLEESLKRHVQQGSHRRCVEFYEGSFEGCRTTLSSMLKMYYSYHFTQCLGSGENRLAQISKAAENYVDSEWVHFSQYLNELPGGQQLVELAEALCQNMKDNEIRNFFTKHADAFYSGRDVIMGAVNLARACLQLCNAMNLKQHSQEAYDQITTYIVERLRSIVVGIRALKRLSEEIWDSLTKQHLSLEELQRRQVLVEKYNTIVRNIEDHCSAMETWFTQQEEALESMKEIIDAQKSQASKGALASAVGAATSIFDIVNGRSLISVTCSWVSLACNVSSFVLDLDSAMRVLPEARRNVDAAKETIKSGKIVVTDVKDFFLEMQGWHTRANIVRDALVNGLEECDRKLVNFLQGLGHPLGPQSELIDFDAAMQEMTTRGEPPPIIRVDRAEDNSEVESTSYNVLCCCSDRPTKIR